MDANQVTEKILADAKAAAEKITRQAGEKEAAEHALLEKQMGEYKKQTEALAQKAANDMKMHLLAKARMDNARQFLAEKRKILDAVFAKASEQLKNLPDDDYRGLCGKLMKAAVETGDEEVLIDANERRIDQEFVTQMNRELGPGFKENLRLSNEKQNIGAGFILRRGKITNNVTLKVLLERAKNDLEIELAGMLFAD